MAIDWNVKNAVNRDVERQHLNKILADIRASVDTLNKAVSKPVPDVESTVGKMVENNTENGINVTYNAAKKVLDFVITDFTITLTGDVTGSGTVSSLGDVSISTSVDDSIGIEEAPTDGLPYWRVAGDWQYVGVALESLANMSGTGFTVIRSNDSWITREFEVVAGELVVTNADGNDGNPTFGLADVVDSSIGTLQGITVDGKGRVTGTTDATITAGAGIGVVNGNAAAGPPTISHADTSSVANLSSDNSNGVVLQDIAVTFDTFGHVQTISVGTIDLDLRYTPLSHVGSGGTQHAVATTSVAGFMSAADKTKLNGVATGATAYTDAQARAAVISASITNGDTTHSPSGDAVFDALATKLNVDGSIAMTGDLVTTGVVSSGAVVGGTATRSESAAPTYQLRTETGVRRWRFQYSATDASDGPFNFDKWNGATWDTKLSINTAATTLTFNGNSVWDAGNMPLASGTYTPTLTNVTNVAGSTAYTCNYLRVGNVVTVSGRIDIDPTAASISTEVGISLPIASNFNNESQLGGTAASPTAALYAAGIGADTVNDRAALIFICGTDAANRRWNFSFTYLIV